jgi:integrase
MSLKAGLELRDARKEAKAILGAVAKGGDPLADKRKAAAAGGTALKAVAEDYMAREAAKIRTMDQRRDAFERLVFPKLGTRQIDDIKRSEIVKLLDDVEKDHGPHMSQAVLSFLSRLFNWHAARNDDFLSPLRHGMGRTKLTEYSRDRVLSDDELRAVWRAAEAHGGPYGNLVRFLVLTAVRRGEAARTKRSELFGGDWIIPAPRMKGKQEHVIPLSKAARAIIDAMPTVGDYVFTNDGRLPASNFSNQKVDLDKASGVTRWRIHDLRRTARSLMSRAGVAPDIAERCIAHKVGGVRGVYDRHAYHDEKAAAFELLAALVERIVNPVDNVVPLKREA